jgi:c-di-GMP-specific phosphodiesterase
MPDERWTWDAGAILQAIAASDVALWSWDPEADRLSVTGAARSLGLSSLFPDCSSAALRALALPQDRAEAEALLRPQPPGTQVRARLTLRGAGTCLWRGRWDDAGRASGMISAEAEGAAAERDGLTGLLERRSFIAQARERLATPGAYELMVADVDRLRRLNEALGHERADLVLAALGSRLSAALGGEALIGRVGEDEFAVLTRAGSGGRPEALRRALEQPLRVAGFDIHPTLSIGAVQAVGGDEAPDAAELLRRAELAVEAARSGRGGAASYGRSLESDGLSRLALEGDLKEAVGRGELVAFYQPVVRLRTGALAGFEALVRWRHPRRGLLTPEQFLPLCGEMGLMSELGALMMREAARQLASWRARYEAADKLSVAVNLSTGELERPGLVSDLIEIRNETGLPAGALKLEVTEGEVMRDPERAAMTLHKLRGAGAALALDDFGTGFSSLSYLSRLPFDTLKIDRYFVRTMATNSGSEKIVSSVVKLGQDLAMEVVAEGVENAGMARRLMSLGCDYGQGYGYAPPMSAQEAEAYLAAACRGGAAPVKAGAA